MRSWRRVHAGWNGEREVRKDFSYQFLELTDLEFKVDDERLFRIVQWSNFLAVIGEKCIEQFSLTV